MNVALIDKNLFASFLRNGEIILPDYSFSAITEDLPTEEAIRLILQAGNPIEYPSQYIIVLYDGPVNQNILRINSVKELIATDTDGKRLFSSQFREDLIIQTEKYKSVFQEYLNNDFQKTKIKKGIIAFRTLCGLNLSDNYDEETNLIHHGIANRYRYRHHFQLPAEERAEPYALMITYDRHAPYPRGWTGYFYDVIESFCYHRNTNLGYSEAVIEETGIFKRICALPQDASSKQIHEAIKDEKFTNLCNEFFYMPGGYLVPYIFFILRDRFRDTESFTKHVNLIEQIKKQFPVAFDTASIFVGGFFGYDKFYDDYYSALDLPFLKVNQHSSVLVNSDSADEGTTETKIDEIDIARNKDNTPMPFSSETLETVFLEGTDLFKKLYCAVDSCLNKGSEKDRILTGLSNHKNDNVTLKEIRGLFISPIEKKDLIKKYLGLSRYPGGSMKKIRDYFFIYYK